MRYASNLNIGDSVVNITNNGASGGNICVSAYTFDPFEELISCGSCIVTPNGLASFSTVQGLISNPLTPAFPTSVVIALVATTGGSCNTAIENTLASGLLAWGTTLHANKSTTPVSYYGTETAFLQAPLSAS
jgi:hypothetical protein